MAKVPEPSPAAQLDTEAQTDSAQEPVAQPESAAEPQPAAARMPAHMTMAGSLPDMSASWSAKVSVSPETQVRLPRSLL